VDFVVVLLILVVEVVVVEPVLCVVVVVERLRVNLVFLGNVWASVQQRLQDRLRPNTAQQLSRYQLVGWAGDYSFLLGWKQEEKKRKATAP
jgi:hypothetical protein